MGKINEELAFDKLTFCEDCTGNVARGTMKCLEFCDKLVQDHKHTKELLPRQWKNWIRIIVRNSIPTLNIMVLFVRVVLDLLWEEILLQNVDCEEIILC
mmetsp:Transcript_15488/g.17242  ORF Transcript_15488/g.17242 Transcript_15488/m.17242 type:complete len:99 (+) Transcript_15488:319-615(+)